MPLSYYPAPTRYSAGWYAVRVLAILSSSLLLIVLLYKITTLYERLLQAIGAQRHLAWLDGGRFPGSVSNQECSLWSVSDIGGRVNSIR